MKNDFYLNIDNVYDRLKKEYLKHGKIIIAYDFDDTIFNYHKIPNRTYDKVINLLKNWKNNADFIVFTASEKDRYDEIKKYLKEIDLKYDKINESMPYANFGFKPYYNILLDDRAGLFECYTLLQNYNILLDDRAGLFECYTLLQKLMNDLKINNKDKWKNENEYNNRNENE